MKTFKSDNTASVHKKVMEALINVNDEHAFPYGDDDMTLSTQKLISELFGGEAHVSFVLNGTGANVIALSAMIKPYEGVICVDTAHINVDECGAFERFTGSKLLQVPHINGKLTVEGIEFFLEALGNEHHSQPRVVSISQLTEMGTAYTVSEIKKLADYAHAKGLLLHVDGARIANAAVSLGVTFKEMITDTGVDVLSFGAAKNGLMYGEAIVSFHESHSDIKYARKQGMQLMSKMRYIAAQYKAIIEDNLWYDNAKQANDMMTLMVAGLKKHKEITFLEEVHGNIAFVELPQVLIDRLSQTEYFYQMKSEGDRGTIRLVTSFDTTKEEVTKLLEII